MNIFDNSGSLPDDLMTLGHYFKNAGYTTGYIGKWHMCHEEPVPESKRSGYDFFLGSNILEFTSDAYETYVYDNNGRKTFLPGFRVDAVTDAAIRYINDKGDKPFFLFVSYIEPHFQNSRDDYPAPRGYEQRYIDPWTPPDLKALGGTSARHLPGYYGMVKRLDEALGRMRDAIFSMKMEDNTILLYTCDHGCHFKTRNSEYKRSCHDSSIRIPMAISGPGFDSGGRVRAPVSLIDIPPTLLDACGIEVPKSMDGISLYNKRNSEIREDVFAEICDGEWMRRCVRTKRWKYSVKALSRKSENKGFAGEYIEEELYDLKADPWEMNNLAGYRSHRRVSDIMGARLLRYLNNLGENVTIFPAKEIESGQKTISEEESLE
jgi:arylsulfatase A-like enzyme